MLTHNWRHTRDIRERDNLTLSSESLFFEALINFDIFSIYWCSIFSVIFPIHTSIQSHKILHIPLKNIFHCFSSSHGEIFWSTTFGSDQQVVLLKSTKPQLITQFFSFIKKYSRTSKKKCDIMNEKFSLLWVWLHGK